MNHIIDRVLCGNCVKEVKEYTINYIQENDYINFDIKIIKSRELCRCNVKDDWNMNMKACDGCKTGVCPSTLYECKYIFRSENN